MLSTTAKLLLVTMRACVENENTRDGVTWGTVYLDNARPDEMSAHEFAGYLSALERAGYYQPEGDDFFGYVKLTGRA